MTQKMFINDENVFKNICGCEALRLDIFACIPMNITLTY